MFNNIPSGHFVDNNGITKWSLLNAGVSRHHSCWSRRDCIGMISEESIVSELGGNQQVKSNRRIIRNHYKGKVHTLTTIYHILSK